MGIFMFKIGRIKKKYFKIGRIEKHDAKDFLKRQAGAHSGLVSWTMRAQSYVRTRIGPTWLETEWEKVDESRT